MIICIVIYIFLIAAVWVWKKGKMPEKVRGKEWKMVFCTLLVSNTIAMLLFTMNLISVQSAGKIIRNSYGAGSKNETYEVTVEGELKKEQIVIEVEEQEYTDAEVQKIFEQVMEELDAVILGRNESRDRVEKDLNLVKGIEGYPIEIQWELDRYDVLNLEGEIQSEKTVEEGTLVEVRGTLSYGEKQAVYVTTVMVFPETLSEKEQWVYDIKESIQAEEEKTRQQTEFQLPESVNGKTVQWSQQADVRGYYILALGIVGCVLIFWKKRQDEKELEEKLRQQMLRDYPDIISKFTLLLSTGMTVKNVWRKIVESYERQKEEAGIRQAYEDMSITYHEMQGGIPEAEAYERFGKRCGMAVYMKFGALLSQNLRKGSKGLSELLTVEAIQAFENRKSEAKRLGEEASTKLLLPMFGMLAVVLVMVVIPAFLSIQL